MIAVPNITSPISIPAITAQKRPMLSNRIMMILVVVSERVYQELERDCSQKIRDPLRQKCQDRSRNVEGDQLVKPSTETSQ